MRNNTDNLLRGSDSALGIMSIYFPYRAKNLVPRFPRLPQALNHNCIFFWITWRYRRLIRANEAVNRQPTGNKALPSDSHPSGQISVCIANMYGIATALEWGRGSRWQPKEGEEKLCWWRGFRCSICKIERAEKMLERKMKERKNRKRSFNMSSCILFWPPLLLC